MGKVLAKVEITAEYVLSSLKEVAERCMERKAVMYFDKENKEMRQEMAAVKDPVTGEVREEGVWEFDSSGANKSLELLGKHIALFTDKVQHSGAVDLTKIIELAQESGK